MPTPDCAILASRGILRLTGPDAGTLLQGLVSNDIDALTPTMPSTQRC